MLPFLLCAAVVGLIWLAVILRWTGLVGFSVVALTAGVCCGHPFFNFDVGPLPITIDRLLLGALFGLYSAQCWQRRHEPKRWTWDEAAIAFFLGVLLLSSLLNGSDAVSTWLFLFALPACFYWVLRQLPLDEKSSRHLLWGVVGLGLYLALTGVAEWRGWHALVFPRYVTSPTYEEFFGRARGPLLNPIGNGMFLTVAIAAAGALFYAARERSRQALLIGLAGVLLIGVYSTLTRSVWLGGIAAIGLFALFPLPRSQQIGVGILTCILGLGVLTASWSSLNAFKRDKDVSVHHMSQSAKLRPLLAEIAWRMFLDRPLMGCGFRQYSEASVEYINARDSEMATEVARGYVQHNVFLAILCETGLVGLAGYVAVLLVFARRAWRLARAPDAPGWAQPCGLISLSCLGGLVINGMFHDISIIPMVNALMFFVAGLSANLSLQFAPERVVALARDGSGWRAAQPM